MASYVIAIANKPAAQQILAGVGKRSRVEGGCGEMNEGKRMKIGDGDEVLGVGVGDMVGGSDVASTTASAALGSVQTRSSAKKSV